jgi:hypothetical protein
MSAVPDVRLTHSRRCLVHVLGGPSGRGLFAFHNFHFMEGGIKERHEGRHGGREACGRHDGKVTRESTSLHVLCVAVVAKCV